MAQRRFAPTSFSPELRRARYLEQRVNNRFAHSLLLVLILVFQLLFMSCIAAFSGAFLILNLWDRVLQQQALQQAASPATSIPPLVAPELTKTPTETPSETPTPLPQPTSPLIPTLVETPTNPPDVAPIDTPTATAFATPTPDFPPTETFTPAPPIETPGAPPEGELAFYEQTVFPATQRLSEALRMIEIQLQSPQFDDQNWRLNVGSNLGLVQDAHQQLSQLQPPASLAVAHAALLAATTSCSTVTQSVTFAVDSSDANLITQVIPQVRSCADGVANAFAQLQPQLP